MTSIKYYLKSFKERWEGKKLEIKKKYYLKSFKERWEGKKLEIKKKYFSLLTAFKDLICPQKKLDITVEEVDIKEKNIFITCKDYITVIDIKTAEKLFKNKKTKI